MKPTDNTNVYTESTQQRSAAETTNANQDNKPSIWREVLVGGVPGILIGVGGVLGYQAWAGPTGPQGGQGGEGPSSGAGISLSSGEIRVAESVTEDMSFSQAFAEARAEVGTGGAFVWHGNVYSTYRADDPEWQSMSDEQRMEHGNTIMAQVHPETSSQHLASVGSHVDAGHSNESVEDVSVNPAPAEDESDVDVHIIGVGQVVAEDGSSVIVGVGQINGMDANFIDSDGDGNVDTVLIDSNSNGVLDANDEMHHMPQGTGITVEGMIADAHANEAMAVEDQLFSDMPDYSNSEDISSLV